MQDDLISRQSALDCFTATKLKKFDFILYAREEIKKLPPVTPQQKYGKWITTRTFMHDGEYYCDRCKCDAPNNERWDYCPNCGAKMQESEEV